MGCGSSALNSDNDGDNPRRRLRVVRPIADEPITKHDNNNIVIAFPLINNNKKEELVEGEVKKKKKKLVVETEATTHDDRDDDDAFNGQSSPSFREYCKNLSLNTPPNISQNSSNNDDLDSGNDDLIINKSELPSKEMTTLNKENAKKERKGGRFKDAINKGMSMNKKMSFAFHRSTNKYNENSRVTP